MKIWQHGRNQRWAAGRDGIQFSRPIPGRDGDPNLKIKKGWYGMGMEIKGTPEF